MQHDPEIRRVSALQFLQGRERGGDFLRVCVLLPPISQKAVAEVFVYQPVMVFDDLLAGRNPGAEERLQALGLQGAAQRSEVVNVRDE